MKRSSTLPGWQGVIMLAVVIAGLVESAYCRDAEVMLLLRLTPIEGGIITPAAGVHRFKPNTTIALTAVARPGYKFFYWLGDVTCPTASATTVYLDAPKIVIAVFEPAEPGLLLGREEPEVQSAAVGGGVGRGCVSCGYAGGGGLVARVVVDIQPRRWIGRPAWLICPRPTHTTVVIPEPATVVLLALGGMFVLARHRPKRPLQKNTSLRSSQ